MNYVKLVDDGLILNLKVIPNSSKNMFLKSDDGLKLKITAPPVDNKANKFVIEYLSKLFKVPKTSIKILKGDTSREKVILFSVLDDKCTLIERYFSEL